MSAFRIGHRVAFRVLGAEGPITGTGEVIKVFAAGKSHWLHIRQSNGEVRMVFEATAQVTLSELEVA